MRRHPAPTRAVVLLSALVVSAGACAPKAAGVRIRHPALQSEVGARDGARAESPSFLFDDPLPPDEPRAREARLRVAEAAGRFVGRGPIVVGGVRYRMDCSGVARGIYAGAGLRLGEVHVEGRSNDTRVLYELVDRAGSLRRANPLPGDLVFFDDTYDQNRDGLRNDPLSHVGVVERVDDDGTVHFVHKAAGGILRYRMNLSRPHDRREPSSGKVLNHYLRRAEGGEPAKTTAELFVAYGTLVVRGDAAPLVAAR